MDRFRLDDPDAAETRAARRDRVWGELIACYGEGEDTDWQYHTDLTDLIVKMIEDELDAIEQPRLPTRSEVLSWFRHGPSHGWGRDGIAQVMVINGGATEDPEPPPTGRVLENANGGNDPRPTRSEVAAKFNLRLDPWSGDEIAEALLVFGWATEDPEPEVDPAHEADFLAAELIHATRAAGITPGAVASAVQFTIIARRLLASGRVQVTPQ